MKVPHISVRDSHTLAAGVTGYVPLGMGHLALGTFNTEASGQDRARQAMTISGLRLRLNANATTSASTVKSRVNGADGNMTLTIPSGTAGYHEEASPSSDSLASGDLFTTQIINGGGGALTFGWVGRDVEVSGAAISRVCNVGNVINTASVTRFCRFAGSGAMTATETNDQSKMLIAVTFKHMRLFTGNNLRTTTSTLRSRKNAANGNMTKSILATDDNVELEDSTNSDSCAVDDLLDWSIQTGTGTGNLNWLQVSSTLEHSSKAQWFAAKPADTSPNQAVNTTRYGSAIGRTDLITTEANCKVKLKEACRISAMRIYVNTNTITANSTVTLRKNGVSTSLVITVGSGVTGWVDATGAAVDFAVDDEVSLEYVTGGTGTDISWQVFIALQEASSAGVTGSAAVTLPMITLSAVGVNKIAGAFSKNIPALTMSATGNTKIAGALSRNIPHLTMTATGNTRIQGAASLTIPHLTMTGSTGPVIITGLATLTVPRLTISAAAKIRQFGAASLSIPHLTMSAVGKVKLTGQGAMVLASMVLSATGSTRIFGAASLVLPSLQLSAQQIASVAAIPINFRRIWAGTYVQLESVRAGSLVQLDGVRARPLIDVIVSAFDGTQLRRIYHAR